MAMACSLAATDTKGKPRRLESAINAKRWLEGESDQKGKICSTPSHTLALKSLPDNNDDDDVAHCNAAWPAHPIRCVSMSS